ncbi:hypothetical protein X797_011806 [Metarhizium robertsii]|uniref:Uncharacterized protein n=1 Tax=Metarhizium robertsii TaxID=568076 RepID=A0A014QQY9_9HYPO|nr:hypothetical protein X797_011806 [Metarhizium robertsii]
MKQTTKEYPPETETDMDIELFQAEWSTLTHHRANSCENLIWRDAGFPGVCSTFRLSIGLGRNTTVSPPSMTRQVLAGALGVMTCVLVDTDSGKLPPASPVHSLTEIGISLEKLGLYRIRDYLVTTI